MTNTVLLVGRIARDPESRDTQGSTTDTSLSVVTDRPARNKEGKTYKDDNGYTVKDSEFHRVTCFNGLATNVAKFCSKGQLVTVQGRIHYTQWDDKDGVKRYGEFCERGAESVVGPGIGRAGGERGDGQRQREVGDAAAKPGGKSGEGHIRQAPIEVGHSGCSLCVPHERSRTGKEIGRVPRAAFWTDADRGRPELRLESGVFAEVCNCCRRANRPS